MTEEKRSDYCCEVCEALRDKPTMVVYWADTEEPLTYQERQALYCNALITCAGPRETIAEVQAGEHKGRKVVWVGTTDPLAPEPPAPKRPRPRRRRPAK